MKVPIEIRTLIQQIDVIESISKLLWSELYRWFEDNNIDTSDNGHSDRDVVANLQDGVGSKELIDWLESLERD